MAFARGVSLERGKIIYFQLSGFIIFGFGDTLQSIKDKKKAMNISFKVVIIALAYYCGVLAKQHETLNMELSKDEINKFSLSNMKRILKDKGVECKDCDLKEHYVEKVFESQKLPVLKKKSAPTKTRTPQDEANIAEVLADLKMKGFGDAKVQRPFTDFDGINDLIAEKFAEKTQEAVTRKPDAKKKASV